MVWSLRQVVMKQEVVSSPMTKIVLVAIILILKLRFN